jgi:hypothetical protein
MSRMRPGLNSFFLTIGAAYLGTALKCSLFTYSNDILQAMSCEAVRVKEVGPYLQNIGLETF